MSGKVVPLERGQPSGGPDYAVVLALSTHEDTTLLCAVEYGLADRTMAMADGTINSWQAPRVCNLEAHHAGRHSDRR